MLGVPVGVHRYPWTQNRVGIKGDMGGLRLKIGRIKTFIRPILSRTRTVVEREPPQRVPRPQADSYQKDMRPGRRSPHPRSSASHRVGTPAVRCTCAGDSQLQHKSARRQLHSSIALCVHVQRVQAGKDLHDLGHGLLVLDKSSKGCGTRQSLLDFLGARHS